MFLLNGRQLACDISAFPDPRTSNMSLDLYDASSALLWSLVPSWSGDEVTLLTAGYEMPQRLEREGGLVGRVECMDDSTRWIPLTVFFLSHTFFLFSLMLIHFFFSYFVECLKQPKLGGSGLATMEMHQGSMSFCACFSSPSTMSSSSSSPFSSSSKFSSSLLSYSPFDHSSSLSLFSYRLLFFCISWYKTTDKA